MADLFENPMGLMGFEFVEFASPTPNVIEPLFEMMGFTRVANHRSKDVALYRQGEINFVVNNESGSVASYFAAEHGPSRLRHGFPGARFARRLQARAGTRRAARRPAARSDGIAAARHQRYRRRTSISHRPLRRWHVHLRHRLRIHRRRRSPSERSWAQAHRPSYAQRLPRPHGAWSAFYERIFNFREIRYFDIKGEYTGLTSRAMTAPDGKIRIPLNEEASKTTGQIEEFLMKYNGEGIQHIALCRTTFSRASTACATPACR